METIKYGHVWPGNNALQIEIGCIRRGGSWTENGQTCGQGLPFHYEQMRRLLWPRLDGEHNGQRWHVLTRDEILAHKVTVLMGSGGTGKTHSAAWIYLVDYWCHPEDTIVLVSSTDLRGLELRVFGEIKKLFEEAKTNHPGLPGNLIESKHAIATDNLDEETVRDLRKGIIGIPCVQNGKFVGLGKYVGIHQKRVRLIADEAQFMGASFLSAFANLNQNEDFKATILGNPNDPYDPLGKAAEPVDGWASHMQPGKTSVWDTKFMQGRCVNLIGTDSPNFDFPQTRFKYLPHKQQIAETLASWGMDSMEYHSQCVGSMRTGELLRRVLTRDLIRQFEAQSKVVWKGTPIIRIYGLDSAYGGDRCVGGYIEFGEDITGKTILAAADCWMIPIRIATGKSPEDQIADRVRSDCDTLGIPPENMFHDSTGRGSLGTALARVWSAQTNPVEFGGRPTDRPVTLDMFIRDPQTGQRRLKRCDEHYVNFVTELWYTIRYAVEASQIRNLPEDVVEELCMRQWDKTKDDKRQVEPKRGTPNKPGMKERTGRSPDMGDWFAICLEGARRRGFKISKLANEESEAANLQWLEDLRVAARRRSERHVLDYRA